MSAARIALMSGSILLLALALQPAGPPPAKVWIVQGLSWRFVSNSDPFRLDDAESGYPARVFASRADAEAVARTLEGNERRGKNPFHYQATGYGRLGPYTKDDTRLLNVLRREGLIPPAYSDQVPHFVHEDPWALWWDSKSPKWSEATRTEVWDALDRVRFFRVLAVKVEPSR